MRAKTHYSRTPLHETATEGSIDIAEILIERGANVRAQSDDGRTPLHEAAVRGHRRFTGLLIERGAYLAIRSGRGWTPLHEALYQRSPELAAFLIVSGSDVNAKIEGDFYPEYTALHFAASRGRNKLVELLIEKGARVNVKDRSGKTPLDLATTNEIREALIQGGAKGQN
ncbi:unnamed protein product [marine sediment metagenome]|uniref:Uncharacterized protein n=1 Tax=marine sediment metagenome TaxID=412755 RepID=X1H7N0_9ZZZZ